jgi:hypothetical protein
MIAISTNQFESQGIFKDPIVVTLSAAIICLTAFVFSELTTDLPYAKFVSIASGGGNSRIELIESRPGIRDIFGSGHTFFVRFKEDLPGSWRSVFVPSDCTTEAITVVRKNHIEMCSVCGGSVPVSVAYPNILLALVACLFLRIARKRVPHFA